MHRSRGHLGSVSARRDITAWKERLVYAWLLPSARGHVKLGHPHVAGVSDTQHVTERLGRFLQRAAEPYSFLPVSLVACRASTAWCVAGILCHQVG